MLKLFRANMKYLKHIAVICFLLCLSLMVNAQEHMKFMGISMGMNIDDFQKELAKKKIFPDKETKIDGDPNCRIYKGKFTGKDCSFFVYYNTDLSVRAALASYSTLLELDAETYFDNLVTYLKEKYSSQPQENKDFKGNPTFEVTIINNNAVIGNIVVFNYSLSNQDYTVSICYTDAINANKKNQEIMDDL